MHKSTPSHLELRQFLPLREHAELARTLIAANDLYRISNSAEYTEKERKEALDESSQLASSVLEELPQDISALNLVARICMDTRELRQAKTLLAKAHQLDEKHESTLLNLGYLNTLLQEYEIAQHYFVDALAINKHSLQAFSGIAHAKLKSGDFLAAFNHYRKLIELGHQTDTVKVCLFESLAPLRADHYQPDLENMLIEAYQWDGLDYQCLANMSASLLTHKYQLDDPNSALDMDVLLNDPLLCQSISHCTMADLNIENLVVAIRQSIMSEVAITRNLRDEALPMVLAIGRYSARCDYILMQTREEESELASIANEIGALCVSDWQIDDVMGALLLVAMYEPLYTQAFSFRLLAHDIDAWPLATQALLYDALYELSTEHQYQFSLFENTSEALLNNEIRRSAERWDVLPRFQASDIYTALCRELGAENVPDRFKGASLSMLIVGAGACKRALYLAKAFPSLSVIAVDDRTENVAYGRMKASQFEANNLVVLHSKLQNIVGLDEQVDLIEFGEALNFVENPSYIIESWKGLLKDDGLVRFDFNALSTQEDMGVVTQLVSERNLSPTTDNIRHLRNAITSESASGLWQSILADERFYTGAGCKSMFFNKQRHSFDLKNVHDLLKRSALEFIGFADMDRKAKSNLNPLAPYNLLAWHVVDQDRALFAGSYPVYCQKQRV